MPQMYRSVWKVWLVCLIAMSLLVTPHGQSAYAAYDAKFATDIADRYESLESKYRKLYLSDLDKVQSDYTAYRDEMDDEFRALNTVLREDMEYLTQLFGNDYRQLEDRYGSDKNYSDALRHYKNQTNPDYSTGAMWAYNKERDKDYSTSALWTVKNAVNPDYSTSPMWKYKNEANPNYSTSTMWKYKNETNENYSTSTMWKLKNESNANYSTSTMWNYKQGNLSKSEAEEKMTRILSNGEEELALIRSRSLKGMNEVKEDTIRKIKRIKEDAVYRIVKQREKTVEDLNAHRKRHFGGELTVKPLVINLDKIKVIIDGEQQSFDQPPVIKSGSTLVPMRAIFERLGAKVSYNNATKTVTATKEDIRITLKLGSNRASVNDQTVILSTPAQTVNNYTMVPLRFVSEALGADVKWDKAAMTVVITTN